MRSNAKQPEIVKTAEPYFQIVKRQLSEVFASEDISELKGDSAAHVKVSTYKHWWFSVGICKYKPGYKSHDLL